LGPSATAVVMFRSSAFASVPRLCPFAELTLASGLLGTAAKSAALLHSTCPEDTYYEGKILKRLVILIS